MSEAPPGDRLRSGTSPLLQQKSADALQPNVVHLYRVADKHTHTHTLIESE